ncbi:SusC/RagA family TonB-linked outer membrane protein [Gelidibacter japonicus]|uniref:SusC/RagA family TonB-linked outer membrane protein n=1 Tax=Gelidibacter japonicus TaxID=1962232 RepID=UPI0013D7CE37|nr:SusC/RagA family TonB-linked outer membrane protein [Gelidibacter japonicus]
MTKNHKSVRWRRIFGCNLLFLMFTLPLTAQDLLVSGKVTDGQLPISGANVLIKNTKKGVVSNFDGRYSITAKATDTLQISYLGYTTVTIPIQNRTTINVTLQEDATALGEVQINAGYYTTTDREKTGSISRITAKEIETQPINNPLAAMQGHLSGVNIVQSTGVPGGGYSIEIRGKNFINGSTNPLFIVNGVPYGSQSLEAPDVSAGINGSLVSPLNAIDPNSIESIEVLKDADATAIYGSRGANGVVLITTKKGKQGKTIVNTNMSTSLGQVTGFRKLMNTQQYLEIRKEAIINDGFGAFLENPNFDFIWPDLKSWSQTRYTDWQKNLIGGTAIRNNFRLSVSGGKENTQFLTGATHLKETTVFPGDSNYKKTSINNAINHQSANQRFTLVSTASFTFEDNQLPSADFTVLANTLEPNAPKLFDNNGNLNWENGTWANPLARLKRQYNALINTLMANMTVSYSLMDNLEFKSNFGFNNYDLESYIIFPSSALNPNDGVDSSFSSLTTNKGQRKSWIIEPQLNWEQQWKNIRANILIGSTFQKETSTQSVQRARGFPNNQLILNPSAASSLEALQNSYSEYKYMAYFGRINLNYQSKYFINLTGRRDGSSRFGPNKQFGNFGAVGAAWCFSKEALFNENTWLSFGKIRGSYGTTGSDNIGDYRFLGTYSTTGFDYNGTSVLEPTGVFNPNFRWETNKKIELGFEFGLFKDRILINTSWYRNRSSNQLIGVPLAATTGFNSLVSNFEATVENTGFEMEFSAVKIINKNLQWTTTFNFTQAKNKLLKFPDLKSSTFSNKYIIGQPLTIVHLYHALGVNPDTGLYQFEDYNDDGNISAEDRQWIVDFAPKFYGGLGNIFSYKNLSMEFFFQFKKQKAYNSLASGASAGLRENGSVNLINRWQQTGDMAPIQRATFGRYPGAGLGGQNQSMSNAAVSDGSFIRLRNVLLSYKVPKHMPSDLDFTVYVQGQNILTITGLDVADPEQTSNAILPPLRQLTLGVQLSF